MPGPSGGGCRSTAPVDRWNGGFVTDLALHRGVTTPPVAPEFGGI